MSDALAARLITPGNIDVEPIELSPKTGEVLVDMAFSAINPVDRYIVQGRVAPDGPLPRTIGTEGAGTVDGRPVVIHGNGLGTTRDGLWATAAVVPEDALVDVPDGVDLQSAAAMGVAGLTAWRTVTEFGEVSPEDRVLVLGASGGVGSIIVSIARGIGATVWGQTTRESNRAWLRSIGCDEVAVAGVDFAAIVSEFSPTIIFDPLGGEFTASAIEALSQRGRLITYGTSAGAEGTVPLQQLYRKGLTIRGYGGLSEPPEVLKAKLVEALYALRDGQFKVNIDSVFPLGQVAEATAKLETGPVNGKILLDLNT